MAQLPIRIRRPGKIVFFVEFRNGDKSLDVLCHGFEIAVLLLAGVGRERQGDTCNPGHDACVLRGPVCKMGVNVVRPAGSHFLGN